MLAVLSQIVPHEAELTRIWVPIGLSMQFLTA